MVEVGGRYRHFKGGVYEVVGIAVHSETGESMVVYRGDSGLWVRPLDMFEGNAVVDGGSVRRFSKVE